jgi:DNA processing protein
MARGIDTIAHRSALQSGGDTVAVFGCGLSHTYPPENRSLRDKIAQAGTVVSEFPISMRPDRNNFPARNRIISGLSYGVIVVEAGEKSGALITVQFALEQGRDVFAVPGSILSPKSFSPNRLIKAGAKLVDGPESILEELPSAVQGLITQRSEKIGIKQELSEKEQSIVSLIIGEEKHIDQLIENSRLSPAEVSATLVQLELSGIVRQLEGKMFIATIKTVSNK